MDNKTVVKWGVSFSSIALTTGIAVYLGFSEGETSNQNNSSISQKSADTQEGTDDFSQYQGEWNNESPSRPDHHSREWNQAEPNPNTEEQFNEDSDYSDINPNRDSQYQQPSESEQFDTRTGGTSF